MFCCIIMCIFLTNILPNRRKRISSKLLDDGTRHGHTLSQPAHNVGQPSAASEMPFKCFRCCTAKKKERKAGEGGGEGGGGVGVQLESPVETHSIFLVFLLHVLLFFYGLWWGVNC